MGRAKLTRAAAFETSNIAGYKLFTTQKVEIIDNKILLPSKPEGDLLFNMMFVYDENAVAEIYQCAVLSTDTSNFAQITTDEIVTGFGMVSYLTKIAE